MVYEIIVSQKFERTFKCVCPENITPEQIQRQIQKDIRRVSNSPRMEPNVVLSAGSFELTTDDAVDVPTIEIYERPNEIDLVIYTEDDQIIFEANND